MSELLKYWPVALFALNALTAWAAWSLRQVAKDEIAKLASKLQGEDAKLADVIDGHDTRLTQLDGRIGHVEGEIQKLPTKADIERLAGEVNKVGAEVGTVHAGVKRIEGFFLAKGVERI